MHVTVVLKNAVANIADLLDRQLALLVDTKSNNGLPANLSGARAERLAVNHGFKAVQIATSAWAAEALKLTMPASVFSRSTECHNQDVWTPTGIILDHARTRFPLVATHALVPCESCHFRATCSDECRPDEHLGELNQPPLHMSWICGPKERNESKPD